MFLENNAFVYIIFSTLAFFVGITFVAYLIFFLKSLSNKERALTQFYEERQKKVWGLILLCQEAGFGNGVLPPANFLELVVDKIKGFTNAEKVVLAFLEEGLANPRKFRVDFSKMIVRGSRRKHPESWWAAEIDRIAEVVLKKKSPVVVSGDKLRKGSSLKNSKKEAEPSFMLCAPLTTKSESFGILSAISSHPYSLEDDEVLILSLLGKLIVLAIKNARFVEQQQTSLIAAERNRLAREMHDGLAQSLFGVMQDIQVFRKTLSENRPLMEKKLRKLQLTISEIMKDLRRYIYELKPVEWGANGLGSSLAQFVKDFSERNGIPVDFVIKGKEDASFVGQEDLYRIAQEALANVAKHAGAKAATVKLVFKEKRVSLLVEDDGKGFRRDGVLRKVDVEGKMGLRNMVERAEALRGICHINSHPGSGTKIIVVVPRAADGSFYAKERAKDQVAHRR